MPVCHLTCPEEDPWVLLSSQASLKKPQDHSGLSSLLVLQAPWLSTSLVLVTVPYQGCHTLIWSLKGYRSISVFNITHLRWSWANQPISPLREGRGCSLHSVLLDASLRFCWFGLVSCLISICTSLQD